MSITKRIKAWLARRRKTARANRRNKAYRKKLVRLLNQVQRELRAQRRRQKNLRRNKQPRDISDKQRARYLEDGADELERLYAARDDILERLDGLRKKGVVLRLRLARQTKQVNRLRRKRKRIRERRKEDVLSPNFNVAEFACRDGTPVPSYTIPALKALCQEVLEPQRARFGRVSITSGYRTRSYNARIGGASNSVHIYDMHRNAVAADHVCSSGSARNWFDNTAGKASGRGLYSSFHHADNRHRIGWAWTTWSG